MQGTGEVHTNFVINANQNNQLGGILMRKQQIAIIALAVWLTLISGFMLLAQSVDFEIFFVLSLIAFLIIVQLIAPTYIRPGYLRYVQFILAAAIVMFGLIVAQKVLEILGLEIVF